MPDSNSPSSNLPELEASELGRYNRHIILPNVGLDGQRKLKGARVLVVGAGGLGSPVALYLAAAGVGTLGLVDSDVVDQSNLQRQVLYGQDDLGLSKVERAQARLAQLNPGVQILTFKERLSSANALDIINDFDLVVDGTDNFPTRYLVNDACVLLDKPLCYGSIFQFEGQASVFHFDGGPCYRCLYPEPPPPHLAPSCEEGGVFGVLPGIVGSIQATEAIKIIIGQGDVLSGRYLLFDALGMRFQQFNIKRNPDCVVCGSSPSVTELIDYEQFCGLGKPAAQGPGGFKSVSVTELESLLAGEGPPVLLDVREDFEREISLIERAIHIPMAEVAGRLSELDAGRPIVVHCKKGGRSAKICAQLVEAGFSDVSNLEGGIIAWAEEIAEGMEIY